MALDDYGAPRAVITENPDLADLDGPKDEQLVTADFDNSGISDAIWNTLTMRDNDGLPDDLVAFYATGTGEQLCLRCNGLGRGTVVVFVPGAEEDPSDLELVADDFGSWLAEWSTRS
jgi:SMI1-KNR4 cell-wall